MCERARQWLSLGADGELSELEQALLDAHLERCSACTAFASDIAILTVELRAAPLAELTAPIDLPRHSRRPVRTFQLAAAAGLVVAAAALGSLYGVLGSNTASAPTSLQHTSMVAFEDNANTLRRLRRPMLIEQVRVIDRHLLIPNV